MCSACKMDGKDLKVFRQRQGEVEVKDFNLDFVPHRKWAKKKRPVRGCPGNDYNEHVYIKTETPLYRYRSINGVWGVSSSPEDLYAMRYSMVCCGCEKKRRTKYVYLNR